MVSEAWLIPLTLLVMLVGVVGVIIPVVPDVWLIWLAALGYGLLAGFDGWIGGIAMFLLSGLTVVGLIVEIGLSQAGAARGGASWQAIAASVFLGLAGLFFPPFGPLIGALLGLFAVEYWRRGQNAAQAWEAVKGYAAGCGWSVILRLVIAVMMILIWGAWVWIAKPPGP